jgi:hypothetical protein
MKLNRVANARIWRKPELVFFLVVFLTSIEASQPSEAAWTPEQILDALEESDRRILNVHSVTLWRDLDAGQVVRWDRGTIDRDGAGRIRVENESGVYSSEGKPVSMRHDRRMYDGNDSITYDFRYDPKLGPGMGSLQQATVYDGAHPSPGGPVFLRDPLTVLAKAVQRGLRESAAAGRTVEIEDINRDAGSLVSVRYLRLANPSPRALRWTATLDLKRGGIVLDETGRTPEGSVRHETRIDYKEDGSGIWLPASGSHRQFDEEGTERRGWDFTCDVVTVNDSQFDDHLFDLSIEPGMHVYDTTMKVGFVAKSKIVGRSEILAEAERAHAARAAKRPIATPDERQPQDAPTVADSRFWLFAVNGLLLVVIIIVLIWRNRTSQ